MATMTTSATMSSMRVAPARIEVAASAPSAQKASTSGQRAPGAMSAGRNTNTSASEQRHGGRGAEEVPRDDVPNRALRVGVIDQRRG